MAIQIPNLGLGDGETGDNELVIRQKYNANFSDATHAASRLVGGAVGNVAAFTEHGLADTGLGGVMKEMPSDSTMPCGFYRAASMNFGGGQFFIDTRYFKTGSVEYPAFRLSNESYTNNFYLHHGLGDGEATVSQGLKIWHSGNATKDSNGFLKGASPVIDMYDNKIGLNHDAEQQGGITFEKLGVGDYLVKGSLGFAQDGWYIETPKDANGNVLVAVVYEQLANNYLSIKTYAKRFDDETGDIVANLLKPRDIPAGRFISLRLHELPKEPPVMPTEVQPEV